MQIFIDTHEQKQKNETFSQISMSKSRNHDELWKNKKNNEMDTNKQRRKTHAEDSAIYS